MIIKNLKKYFTFEVQVQAQDQSVLHGLLRIFTQLTGVFDSLP